MFAIKWKCFTVIAYEFSTPYLWLTTKGNSKNSMELNIKQNCFAHIIFSIVWSYIFFRNLNSKTFILANLYRRHNYSFRLYAPHFVVHSLHCTAHQHKTNVKSTTKTIKKLFARHSWRSRIFHYFCINY